jgi:hypothetical protein
VGAAAAAGVTRPAPHAGSLSICTGGKKHTVESGDTCASISTKYDLGWDVIYGLNPGLDCQGGQVALPAGLELCVGTGEQALPGTSAGRLA